MSETPLLFTPLDLRGLTLRNRAVISPMCQYSSEDGMLNDWHLAHLGRFAMGGAGLVFTEATAVEPRGRITHGDAGLWSDDHVAPFKRVIDFIHAHGAAAAIQIAHAGRKASIQRPWFGNGPLTQVDIERGDEPWDVIGPSAVRVGDDWLMPREASLSDIAGLVTAFADTAKRALEAGVDTLEIHGAHGYLIASFLSPVSNRRTDRYGGDRNNRMRFALEITEAVRAVIPAGMPLFFRISAVDGSGSGWDLEDSVALAEALKPLGVDVIDCSSGGISGPATAARGKVQAGFQVPYAAEIRRRTGLRTQAVGLITDPRQAEDILQAGDADLIAIAREALSDPHWAHHAARTLGTETPFGTLPDQYGWWLERRELSSEFYRPTADG